MKRSMGWSPTALAASWHLDGPLYYSPPSRRLPSRQSLIKTEKTWFCCQENMSISVCYTKSIISYPDVVILFGHVNSTINVILYHHWNSRRLNFSRTTFRKRRSFTKIHVNSRKAHSHSFNQILPSPFESSFLVSTFTYNLIRNLTSRIRLTRPFLISFL